MLQFNKDSRSFSVVSKAENKPTTLFVESEPLGRTVAVKENSSGDISRHKQKSLSHF